MKTIAAITLVAMMAGPAAAQDMPKPGPEYDVLKRMVGTWETTMKFGGMESKGMTTFKMELNGLWLAGSLESELLGQKFMGKSLDSYDATKKKYVSVWVDSMSTYPMIMEGTYDKAKKEMMLAGEGPGMDGKTTKYRSVSKYADNDTTIMTMWMGDGKEPAFTVTYKRKK